MFDWKSVFYSAVKNEVDLRDYFLSQFPGNFEDCNWLNKNADEWSCTPDELKKFIQDPMNADADVLEHIHQYLQQEYEENC